MYAPGDKVQGQGELRWGTAGPNLGPPPSPGLRQRNGDQMGHEATHDAESSCCEP